MEPTGQVAPQVKVTTSPPNKPTRGWRRSRHLRRVKRPRQGSTTSDPETLRFPYRIRFKSPFFEWFFREILVEFFIKIIKKGAAKKLWQTDTQTDTQTDRQTDRIGPISSSSGVVFWTAKTQIPFAKTSKTCPENKTRNSLNQCATGRPKPLPFFGVVHVHIYQKYVQFCQKFVFCTCTIFTLKNCTCTNFELFSLFFVDFCCTCTTSVLQKLYMYNFECTLFEIRCTTRCTVFICEKGSAFGV